MTDRYSLVRFGWSRIDPARVRRILFVSFSNLGDAILSLPALRRVCRAFPEAVIEVRCAAAVAHVFEGRNGVSRVVTAADRKRGLAGRWKEWRELSAHGYDLSIDLRRSYFGLLGRYRYVVLFAPVKKHKRIVHLSLLDGLGVNDPAWVDGGTFAARPAGLQPRIVIAPGSKSDLKCWPAERYACVAERMVREWGARVVWIGDARDASIIGPFLSGPHLSATQNLAGQIDWRESSRLIRESDLVLTNDSAPLHAADDSGIPVVALFGPTDPNDYGSQQTPGGIVFRNAACSPCGAAQCRRRYRECLDEVSVDEVWKRCTAVLGGARAVPNESILVVRLDRLGDALLSYPALRALKRANPQARITVLCRKPLREVFERCRWVDEVWVYDYGQKGRHRSLKGYAGLIAQVRNRSFSRAYILKPTLRANLIAFLAGIPLRAGLDGPAGFLLTRRVDDRRAQGHCHEAECAMDVVRADVAEAGLDPAGFEIFDSDRDAARRLLRSAGLPVDENSDGPGIRFLVMHPGSSCLSKRWPAESFAALARLWHEAEKLPIVVVGGEEERPTADAIGAAAGVGVYSLAGRTSVGELGAILQEGGVLVSNDSGPAHLAAAVGAPVLVIFGRTRAGLSPARWAPLGSRAGTVQKNVGCAVCLADRCPIGFECLTQLKAEEVFERLRALTRGITIPVCAPHTTPI